MRNAQLFPFLFIRPTSKWLIFYVLQDFTNQTLKKAIVDGKVIHRNTENALELIASQFFQTDTWISHSNK